MAESDSRRHELKAGAVLSYGVIVLQFAIAMIYTPIMLRLLGQVEFGLYSLVTSMIGYLGLISFGFSGAYMRFYARFVAAGDLDGVRRLNGLFLIVFSVMGVIAALGGASLALNVGSVLGSQFTIDELRTARVLFFILGANMAISFPASVFNAYVISQERFVFQRLLQVAGAIVGPMAVLPLLFLGYQSIGMATATTAVNVALTVRNAAYCRSALKMRFSFRGFDLGLLKEVAVFSGYVFIGMIVDQVNWNVDKFIIGRFRGAILVAIYGVAAFFNLSYMSFSTAISSVFIPRVNRMVASSCTDEEMSGLFTRVGRVQFIVLGLILSGFVFFGRSFIQLWAGGEYVDAYAMALLLMVPVSVPLIQNLGIEIQRAKNLHKFRSWVYLAGAVGNIALSIPLTQRYGGVGAASAGAIPLVICNGVIMNWYYQRRVGLDIKDFWKQIGRLSLGAVPALVTGTIIACTADLRRGPLLLLWGALYILVYVVGAWSLGMNDYERHLFGSPIRRAVARWR